MILTEDFIEQMEARWTQELGNVTSPALRRVWKQLADTFSGHIAGHSNPEQARRWYVLQPPTGSGNATSRINSSPVHTLFDGDAEKAGRYLKTLAGELDSAAVALPDLVRRHDPDGIRRLHHRLQNGLNLVGATVALDQIAALADAPEGESQLDACRTTLADIAGQLRGAVD